MFWSHFLVLQPFSFRENRDSADKAVRDINVRIKQFRDKLSVLKPDFDRLDGLIDRVFDHGGDVDNVDPKLFTAEERAFWKKCEGKFDPISTVL